MKWKTNNNTLLEQFQNQIELSQKEAASILWEDGNGEPVIKEWRKMKKENIERLN
jgi:hypothetical protein